MSVQEMLRSHPTAPAGEDQELIRCIEECLVCAQACTSCADASVAEDDVASLRLTIRLCLDCADVCESTGRVATRLTGNQSSPLAAMLEACADACRRSGEECERHAEHHEHCRLCADECKRCEEACRALIGALDAIKVA
jgi:hypothetical protein